MNVEFMLLAFLISAFDHNEGTPYKNLIREWMALRDGLDTVVRKRKFLATAGNLTPTVQVRSLVTMLTDLSLVLMIITAPNFRARNVSGNLTAILWVKKLPASTESEGSLPVHKSPSIEPYSEAVEFILILSSHLVYVCSLEFSLISPTPTVRHLSHLPAQAVIMPRISGWQTSPM